MVRLGSAASKVNPQGEKEEMKMVGALHLGFFTQSEPKSNAVVTETPSTYRHMRPQTTGVWRCAALALHSFATGKSRKAACFQVHAFCIWCLNEQIHSFIHSSIAMARLTAPVLLQDLWVPGIPLGRQPGERRKRRRRTASPRAGASLSLALGALAAM